MKWKIVLPLLFVVLFISLASAQELNILQDEYVAGETVQAYIHNTSISSSQISLLDNESNVVSVSKLLTEYRDDQYFVYFNLASDLEEGLYTVLAGSLEDNFTIFSSDDALAIKPGIVVLDDGDNDFTIEITNNGGDAVSVTSSASDSALSPRQSAFTVNNGDTKNHIVDYDYDLFSQDESLTLTYGSRSYTIPIIYPEEIVVVENVSETNVTVSNETVVNETVEDPVVVEALAVLTDEESILISLEEGGSFEGSLLFQNVLGELIEDLSFTLTGDLDEVVVLNVTESFSLDVDEVATQYLWVNQEGDARLGEYSGDIVLANSEYSIVMPLTVIISEIAEEPVDVEPVDFDETVTFIDEGEEDEGGIAGTTVVAIILILVLIIIFIFMYRQTKKYDEKKFNQYIEETKRK